MLSAITTKCNGNTSWFPEGGRFGNRLVWWVRTQGKLWELERIPSFRENCHGRLKTGDVNEVWVLGEAVWECSCCQALWLWTSSLWNRLCSFLGSQFKMTRASGLEQFEVYGLCLSAKEKALIEGSRTCYLPELSFQLCFRLAVWLPVNLCLHLSCLLLVQSFFGPGFGSVSVCSS